MRRAGGGPEPGPGRFGRAVVIASTLAWAASTGAAAQTDDGALNTIRVAPDNRGEPADRSDTISTLDTIVVSGTRTEHRVADAPVEVQVISARDIAHSGARDLAELLQREGGVYVTPLAGRGTSIEIQGLSADQVLVLVDGRRMIGRVNGAIDLTRLRLDSVERVEIVKGPTSALYGADALGGVVNLITRRGGSDGAVSARADTQANLDFQGNQGWTLGNLSGQVSGTYSDLKDYDLDKSRRGRDGSDAESRNAAGNVDWKLSEGAGIEVYGAYALDDARREDGATGGGVYDVQKRIEEVRTGVSPHFAIGADTDLRFDAYYNRYYDQFLQIQRNDDSNIIDEETTNQLYVGNGQLDQRLGAHRLSLGGEYQFERLSADRLQQSGERDRQSVFVQDEWSLLDDRLHLVPGLRYDRDSQYGSQVSPKLALRYDITRDWLVRAGYGRGYRAPDFKQLLLRFDNPAVGYEVVGNPDLKPERGNGFNAGITWLPDTRTSVSLGGYYNRVHDLIDIVFESNGPPVKYTYANVESARLMGLDAQVQWRPWQPLELRLGASLLDTEDRDTGEELSGRARYKINGAVRFEQPDYALGMRGVWIDQRRFTLELDSGGAPTAPGTTPAYALIDARLEWTRWRPFTLALGGKNLLDEGDPTYLPITPRAGYIELRVDFK